jgi:PAS domain-containing protein
MLRQMAETRGLRGRAETLLTKTRTDISAMSEKDVAELVYELQVHQMELQMQNEELTRVQADLQHSRQKYCDLYDFAPIGYLTLGRMGNIVDANFLASSWLGLPRDALKGKRFFNFVAPESQDRCFIHFQDVFSSGGRQTTGIRLTGKYPMAVQLNSQVNIPEDGYCCTTLTEVHSLA